MNNNYIADYHVHSKISPDSSATLTDIYQEAVKQKISEIALTDHYEFYNNRPAVFRFGRGYLDHYFEKLLECRTKSDGKVKVLAGLEMGQMHLQPADAKEMIANYPFDYLIGSVHKLNDVDLSNFKYLPETIETVTEQYYEQLFLMAKECDYDCIGHLNLVKRYSKRKGIVEPEEKYQAQIIKVLQMVIDRGKGIEINTSGIRQGLGEALPSRQILCWYHELGGEILTIGSDAHRAKDVGADYFEVLELLRGIGFSKLAYFDQRQCSFRKI